MAAFPHGFVRFGPTSAAKEWTGSDLVWCHLHASKPFEIKRLTKIKREREDDALMHQTCS